MRARKNIGIKNGFINTENNMITTFFLNLILLIVTGIFYFLPVVTMTDIPLVGSYVSSTLASLIQTWNAFLITFPYAQTAWDIFLYVIIPFELIMLAGRFFLGHRLPVNHN